MKLGEFEITTISGGRFWVDGGTMFGVVPRALWVQEMPTDSKNRIPQATNCVLVRTGRRTVLIDTGYGSKLPEKQRKILTAEEGDPLAESLTQTGVPIDDVDTVILSHLHFDHAGGATVLSEDGRLVPTFRNAEYFAQKTEWEMATAGWPELRGAYPLDNLLPLEESGQLTLIDGDVEIVPGIRGEVTGGHTLGHQVLTIESDGQTALFLADACPTWRHLRTLWCMAYDVDLLQARRVKPRLLGQIADNGWLALSDHDPDHAAVRLARDDDLDFVVTKSFKEI